MVSILALSAGACARATSTQATSTSQASPVATAGGEATQTELTARDFDPRNFDRSTNIDNPWLPLQPGTRWMLNGHALDGKELIRRRVVITVTDLTKVVDGVRTVVVYELDYTNDELDEAEIALFAQDDGGAVWHFGEYPEEYQGGVIVKTPAWIAGIENARPGIAMQAAPHLGAPSYAQGWGPQVGWNDRSETYKVDARACVPVDCYEGVLVIREFSRTEPGAFQLKYYAPGVGHVRVGWGGPNEEEREVLVLETLEHLNAEAMAKLRKTVLAQDERGYRISKDVYAHTRPAEHTLLVASSS